MKALLALALVFIPSIFLDFTVKGADFVKTDSANGAAMWVDRDRADFPLYPEWKLVKVKVRLQDGTESLQTYLIDYCHNRSALVEVNDSQVPIKDWEWHSVMPEIR